MSFDSILKTLGIKEKSLVEKVNDRIMKGYEPSAMAKVVVGKVSSKRFNEMMSVASSKYNETHKVKVFKDE
ncbi:hypothetical protein P4S68_16505 [Pseudoalteromonas sp. Hal099]|nr:hypothetical protein [Pseudoalteromonas agarivorans]